MTDRVAEPLHPVARELAEAHGGLMSYPPVERWEDWEEYDPVAWPQKVKRRYSLIPTICFNCEAACGLLAYVDQDTLAIQKFEGNPVHPGSRGRNCAKGPATLNQVQDPERILYPLRRQGERGSGRWERVTWDEVLDDIAGRIRAALVEGRQKEIMYHLGRPGHELIYLQRVFHAWGIDGHNSHTNVCSASARAGYAFWHGADRPSPDHANARFILLLSSHLETGHYFNPHAQRIIDGKARGAKICVIDTRLSNTAAKADYWLSAWPGSEAAVLRAICRAGSALATHVWRNAAAGNLGGWQVARALELLVVLMGAVGAPGGTSPNSANKFIPAPPMMPPPSKIWNELMWPREYPLAF